MDERQKDVEKFKSLMHQSDGTAKFVALFLLLKILDEDETVANQCWGHIDPKFIDKLLFCGNSMTAKDQARH